MRRKIFHVSLFVVTLIAGTGAFAMTWTWKAERRDTLACTRQWLGLSQNQCQTIRREDPGFVHETQALSDTLTKYRQALADCITNPASDADTIKAAAQMAQDAHHNLMRRVLQHLLVVRRHADPGQCMRLNNLCSGIICSGGNPDGQGHPRQGQGMGLGNQHRGQGMGQGPRGMGRGQGFQRRGNPLAVVLDLTDAQHETARQNNPSFEEDVQQLTGQIREAHAELAAALKNPDSSDSQVEQSLEKAISLRVQLEQCTVDYVLSIRNLLNTTQQQRLMGITGNGQRWRYGATQFDSSIPK